MKQLLTTALLIVLLVGTASAQNSIIGSAHDLSSGTGIADYKSTDEAEVCIFCHTPHNATTVQVPLWNRSNPTTSYTTYWSSTVDAYATDNRPTIDGTSLVCLSCHDGSMGLNAIANGGTPTMTANTITGSALMGSDLSNDHPVSFVYATAQASDAGLKNVNYHLDGNGKLQCSSCHDVHKPGSSANGDAPFLRESNDGSALCLECHDK